MQESLTDLMVRLVKLLKDLEGMIRIAKVYTGKLELAFALVCSKRIVQIDQQLHTILSNVPDAVWILDTQFTPSVKGLLGAVKLAVSGDFVDLEFNIADIKNYSASLIQSVKQQKVESVPEKPRHNKIIDRTNSIQFRTRKGSDARGSKEALSSPRPRSVNLDSSFSSPTLARSDDEDSKRELRANSHMKQPRGFRLSNSRSPPIIRKVEFNYKENTQCQMCKSLGDSSGSPCSSCGRESSGKWRCIACTAWTTNTSNLCSTCGNQRTSSSAKQNKSFRVLQPAVLKT